jgi:thiol-disulfide isomerase/thioredoxin
VKLSPRSAWKRLRSRYWASLLFDAVVIIAIFVAISAWQTRDLPNDENRPLLAAHWLDDMRADSVIVEGEVGVIYFFAPWCFYCRKSIDNLDGLVANGQLPWARAVALDYGSLDEVREFIRETGVTLPVLLGNAETGAAWQVRAYPTYFVIDEDGAIASRSVGYSTYLGLKTRTWMAQD